MIKTYRLLNHSEPLKVDEIRKLYSGYWVYVVNAQFSSGRKLVSGIPVVCGECAYDGAEDGIYEQFKKEEYGEHKEMYLFKPELISALESLRAAHA